MPKKPNSFAARKEPPPLLLERVGFDEGVSGWVPIQDRVLEGRASPSRPVFICVCGEVLTLKPYQIDTHGHVRPAISHHTGTLSDRQVAEIRRTHSKTAAENKIERMQAELDALNPSKGCGFDQRIELLGYRGPKWEPGQDWQDERRKPVPVSRPQERPRWRRDPEAKKRGVALMRKV